MSSSLVYINIRHLRLFPSKKQKDGLLPLPSSLWHVPTINIFPCIFHEKNRGGFPHQFWANHK